MTYSWAIFWKKKKKKKNSIPKDACTPRFTEAIFIGGMTCNIFFYYSKTEEIKRIKTVQSKQSLNMWSNCMVFVKVKASI